jgi:mycothiol synthase
MAAAMIRRLGAADAAAFGVAVDRAREAGELLGSSAPQGAWVATMAFEAPAEVAVADADGTLAGFILPEAKGVVVDPAFRRRGVGRALVEEGIRIERERGRPDLILGVVPGDAAGEAFLRATGFTFHSTVWDLDLATGMVVAPPAWPPGTCPRPTDAPSDVPALVDLFNAAFADHPTPLQLAVSPELESWLGGAVRAGDLLILVDDDGRPAGFCSTEPERPEDGTVGAHGEIWTIGVRPGLQGRGIGRQLLRWGIARLRSIGVERVSLAVNGRNPRALGLYESEGFVRVATRDRWSRPVPALALPAAPAG